MNRACLLLLAGVYAPQLSSFGSHSDLFLLASFVIVAGVLVGKAVPVLSFVAGYCLFAVAAGQVSDARIPAAFVGDSIMTDVRIIDFPRHRGPTATMTAEVPDNLWVPGRIRVSWFEPSHEVRLGDVWRLELRLRRPRGSSNPGVFDYETWLFRERIAATAYVVEGRRNVLLRRGDSGSTGRLRQHVVNRIATVVAESESAAVLSAISVGARHQVSAEQWERYARTGTSHLMAISGLHVGMVAAAGYFLAALMSGLLVRRGNHHLVSIAVALGLAGAYAIVSGLAVPAQRSALMIALFAMAVLLRRPVKAFTVITTACVVVVVAAPLVTLGPGFKLSFLAVLVLMWMACRLASVRQRSLLSRPIQVTGQIATMQILLLFGLVPLTVLIFGRVSLAAPLVNLIVVPIFSLFTVPLTLCGLLLDGPLQVVGDFLLRMAAQSLGIVEWIITRVAQVPLASVVSPSIEGWSLILLFLPLAWVLLPVGWPGRGIAWLAMLAIVLYEPPRPAVGCAAVDVLDVGQGLAVSVRTQSTALLFDTGPAFRGGGDAAESVVLPFLASRGIGRLDELVVSHADNDHSGGVVSLIRKLPVTTLRVGETIGWPGTTRRCSAGTTWHADGVDFEFLYPAAGHDVAGNDASCVLQISTGNHRLLMTGDIERPAEFELLRSGALQPVDAVIVPHHGSRTSSSPSFVQALRPQLAIISAGFGNRWGLPHAEVVDRWRAAGAKVLTTATSGAISLDLCGQGGIRELASHRVRRRRIWHD